MAAISHSRFVPADPAAVEQAITDDVGAFVSAAGYDSVEVSGDSVDIERQLGLATLALSLRLVEDDEATLAFRQEDGMFEELTMEYLVEPDADGTQLSAQTEFTLGGVTGSVLDETIVRRQRTKELEAQFDYVEQTVLDDSG